MKFEEAAQIVYERSSSSSQPLMLDGIVARIFGNPEWIRLFLPHADRSLNENHHWTSEERTSLRRALHLDNASFRRLMGLPDAPQSDLSPQSRYLEFARREGPEKLVTEYGEPFDQELGSLIEAQISGELPDDFLDRVELAVRVKRKDFLLGRLAGSRESGRPSSSTPENASKSPAAASPES